MDSQPEEKKVNIQNMVESPPHNAAKTPLLLLAAASLLPVKWFVTTVK